MQSPDQDRCGVSFWKCVKFNKVEDHKIRRADKDVSLHVNIDPGCYFNIETLC